MKTPRELLLKRHEAALPKLDALRAAALPARSQLSTFNSQPASLWERLLGPNPLAWAGLAAVWLVLFAVNRSGGEAASSVSFASRASQPSEAAVAEIVRERRREMAELLNLDEPKAAVPSRSELHPKRSQRREEFVHV
ncbi:MAG: hypothetical protein FD161_2501 [Limisphaerales bacterium]|nr:MAG: hypothetical protein FD161_2501 [Limisphaerales bacterium]KAG0508621.1 MAG: hypothetical protein E1N63_2252 [Limisphaerales bacterium]TXT48062.1 MAG: hypothetical protein FD140_3812 [Limisphaerales bacterium]